MSLKSQPCWKQKKKKHTKHEKNATVCVIWVVETGSWHRQDKRAHRFCKQCLLFSGAVFGGFSFVQVYTVLGMQHLKPIDCLGIRT